MADHDHIITALTLGRPAHCVSAFSLLLSGADLRPREGQFLGGIAFDSNALTERQANWLRVLLSKHGLPPLAGDGA